MDGGASTSALSSGISSDTAAITISAAGFTGAGLTQTAAINFPGTFSFGNTTTSRATLIFQLATQGTNTFGTFIQTGTTTVLIGGTNTTRIVNHYTLGDGTNGSQLIISAIGSNAGRLMVGGLLTNATNSMILFDLPRAPNARPLIVGSGLINQSGASMVFNIGRLGGAIGVSTSFNMWTNLGYIQNFGSGSGNVTVTSAFYNAPTGSLSFGGVAGAALNLQATNFKSDNALGSFAFTAGYLSIGNGATIELPTNFLGSYGSLSMIGAGGGFVATGATGSFLLGSVRMNLATLTTNAGVIITNNRWLGGGVGANGSFIAMIANETGGTIMASGGSLTLFALQSNRGNLAIDNAATPASGYRHAIAEIRAQRRRTES